MAVSQVGLAIREAGPPCCHRAQGLLGDSPTCMALDSGLDSSARRVLVARAGLGVHLETADNLKLPGIYLDKAM